jgi:hypothetical protein
MVETKQLTEQKNENVTDLLKTFVKTIWMILQIFYKFQTFLSHYIICYYNDNNR